MKTLHISIIAILSVVVFSSSLAYAEQPLLNFYNNSQLVIVGKVISLSQVPTTTSNPSQTPNQTRYDIQVEQYYKNPQVAKLITVYGYAKGIYFGQDPTFNVGDRVFLYLNQENGYYQIQPHSFALNNDCDARPMIPMPTLPFEPPPISAPAYGRVFEFQSAEGTRNDTFGLGDKIHITFVAENYLPVIKYGTLNFTIKTENNTNLVFNDTKQITIPACNGNVPVSWDFVPKTSGTYFVNVNTSGSVNLGKQVVLFTEPSLGNSFDVSENTSGISLAKAPYLPSPLQQFKSGIKAEYVKCNNNLHLIIKAEDGSFACVTIETGKTLAMRGWATTFDTGISIDDYYTKCNDLYQQLDAGIPVLYIPTNSIGKICVKYSNPNNTPEPFVPGIGIFNPTSTYQNATGITVWRSSIDNMVPPGDSTEVYFVKTGNQTGLYGLRFSCGDMPFAVGYDNNSTMSSNDFPFARITYSCPVMLYNTSIEGLTGIGVKYIPYP